MPEQTSGQAAASKRGILAGAHHFAGRTERARALYDSARVLLEDRARTAVQNQEPWARNLMSLLAVVRARLSPEEEAVRAGRSAVELLPLSVDAFSGHRGILNLAAVHAILGQEEEALALLEEWLDYGPYRSLHDDPRFEELLRTVERTREPR